MRRVVIALLLLGAVGLLYAAGRNGNTDPEPIVTEGVVEAVIPGNGSPSVLRQAEIGIDLAPGWTGELNINGVPIPDDQIRRNDPLNQLFFTPGEGREIEQLPAGRVLVIASIWNFAEGETREDARNVTWSFTAL
jgi:hypothetical protein